MLEKIALRVFPRLKRLYDDRNRLFEECNRLRATEQRLKLSAELARQGVELVLDVGANTGQFARSLRTDGYAGKIISFEPLSAAFAVLQHKCAQDRDWECHNLAIGDAEGSATINVSANSLSSSLLPVRARTLEIEPRIAYVAQETVVLR